MPNAHNYALSDRNFRPTSERPTKQRAFKVPLIELLRPDEYAWPDPISIEQAFELMSCIVRSADDERYKDSGADARGSILDLIAGNRGSSHGRSIPSLNSTSDLRRMFHNAILGRPTLALHGRWRRDHRLTPDGVVEIKKPTYRAFAGVHKLKLNSEVAIRREIDRICDRVDGAEMAVSMNPIHVDCRTSHGVSIGIGGGGEFAFYLGYGDAKAGERGSVWSDVIARTREGESFLDTFGRARDAFDCLVHGKRSDPDMGDYGKTYASEHVLAQVAAINPAPPVPPPARLREAEAEDWEGDEDGHAAAP